LFSITGFASEPDQFQRSFGALSYGVGGNGRENPTDEEKFNRREMPSDTMEIEKKFWPSNIQN
jgi:hypothetical protein